MQPSMYDKSDYWSLLAKYREFKDIIESKCNEHPENLINTLLEVPCDNQVAEKALSIISWLLNFEGSRDMISECLSNPECFGGHSYNFLVTLERILLSSSLETLVSEDHYKLYKIIAFAAVVCEKEEFTQYLEQISFVSKPILSFLYRRPQNIDIAYGDEQKAFVIFLQHVFMFTKIPEREADVRRFVFHSCSHL